MAYNESEENNSTVNWIPGPIRRWLGLGFDEPKRYPPSDPDDDRRASPRLLEDMSRREETPRMDEDERTSGQRVRRIEPGQQDVLARRPDTAIQPRVRTVDNEAPSQADRIERVQRRVQDTERDQQPRARRIERVQKRYPDSQLASRPAPSQPSQPLARRPRVSIDRPIRPGMASAPRLDDGSVQPISYLLKAYARGALPPQGLEEFTKEARATFRQVGDFYSYWIRFQTEDLGRIVDNFRTSAPSRPVGSQPTEPPMASYPPQPNPRTTKRVTPENVDTDLPEQPAMSSSGTSGGAAAQRAYDPIADIQERLDDAAEPLRGTPNNNDDDKPIVPPGEPGPSFSVPPKMDEDK